MESGHTEIRLADDRKDFRERFARAIRVLRTIWPQLRAEATTKGLCIAPPDRGVYPTVDWPAGARENLLFVSATSVVTTTKRTFVIASVNGRAHWVDVRKGPAAGENVSIPGQVAVGQEVVKRASDEIRDGTPLVK